MTACRLSVGLLIPLALQAQTLTEAKALYDAQCEACHGEDARGSDRAPALANSRRLRSRTTAQIRQTINKGNLDAGMPKFDLPAPQLDALASYVRALNSPAADNQLPGDPAVGEQFFFGTGQCATCHMVSGKGKAIGPDLSNVGREMTAPEIQAALLRPSAQITPGYELVTVKLKDGKTLQGFARNRSDFDLQLQDLEGRFHLLRPGQFTAVQSEKQSPMPALKAPPEQLQNLVAYLGHLTGVKPGSESGASGREEPSGSRPDFPRILNTKSGDWLTYNGNISSNRYSELTQLNTANVSQLGVKWIFSVPHFGVEATPLVADGVMYFTGPNQSYAVDAVTGRQIWHYARPMTPGLIGDASLGTNKGMAILGDKVFQVTDNAHLLALNRTTGQLVWETVMPEEPMHYGSTVAPLVVKDLVIAGVSGGDRGIRGFLAAYSASTGKLAWRRWTVPPEPKELGGATWLTGSYDSESDTLFWATGNPFPDSDDRNRPGDNLYTNCVLALDPATGDLKWHYQFTPHDIYDWDATEPNVLVDTKFKGQDRKLLLHADRNGFFYVLDRTNGKVLLADKFVKRLTWASGIGSDGRPQMLPVPNTVCPAGEATNYNSTAFSPATHLYYVMALDSCRNKRPPAPDPPQKYLRAIDIDTGKIAWENALTGSTESKRWSGVLATASNLLFYGTPIGDIAAVDARDGKPLWHFVTNQTIKAAPITYMIDGKQYVAIAAGSDILCFAL
jgi:putative heme-binding domain-containing protein